MQKSFLVSQTDVSRVSLFCGAVVRFVFVFIPAHLDTQWSSDDGQCRFARKPRISTHPKLFHWARSTRLGEFRWSRWFPILCDFRSAAISGRDKTRRLRLYRHSVRNTSINRFVGLVFNEHHGLILASNSSASYSGIAFGSEIASALAINVGLWATSAWYATAL